ncbi:MAG: hypothetical protein HY953_08530 [Candidatus Rokubacteria bacterium]|nr:hypothetical protein [Candidatus Rokubacteria bacterium]
MTKRLIALLARPWTPLTAAVVGTVLTLPALGGGLLYDDYFHRSILLGVGTLGRDAHPVFELFSFIPRGPRHEAMMAKEMLTWWVHPDLSIALLRPLSALTYMLDYALWPDVFAAQHLHSLLWYGLAVFAVATLYRQIHGATAIAGLAAILFAVDGSHAMCVGWLANRHALITLTVGIFAVQAHVRWQRGGGTAWAVVAAATFAAGLFCSEAGLAAAAYVAAWQLTMDDGTWKNRIAALLPYGILVIGWRVIYEHLGYGSTGSSLYVDPGHHPVDFLLALAERWPTLQLAQWFQVSSDAFAFLPRTGQIGLAVVGAAACLVLIRVFRPLLAESREARFWATGMSLALVPLCAAFPMDRLLLFSGVGAFALLALLVEHLGLLPGSTTSRSTGRTFARVMIVLHGPLAAVLLVARVAVLPLLGAPMDSVAANVPADSNAPRQTFVFVNGSEMFSVYLGVIREMETPALAPRRVALLASIFNDNAIYREDADTLVITAQGGFLRAAADQLMRSLDTPFKIGEQIERPDFTATVRADTADGRPEQMAFRFRAPLESPEYRWLACGGKGVREFRLPPVGSQIDLPVVNILSVF